MSDFHENFITHLRKLEKENRGALAALRRSLGFAPGAYAAAMPYVEPFAASDGTREPQRQALYLAAGLFAANPRHRSGTSLATALAEVRLKRDSDSIERRFIALLSADAEALPVHLRYAVSLLAAEELACDYAALAKDLGRWLDPWQEEARDYVRQQWARDFYRRLAPAQPADKTLIKEDTP